MLIESLFGGAALGVFTAAFVNQLTARAANETIDLATEEVSRIVAWLRGIKTGDPEVAWLLRAISTLDLEARVRVAQMLTNFLESDHNAIVRNCVKDLRFLIKGIEITLRDIKVDLIDHQKKWLHEWKFSNIRPMGDDLKVQLDSLDKKVQLLYRITLIAAVSEQKPIPEDREVKKMLPNAIPPDQDSQSPHFQKGYP